MQLANFINETKPIDEAELLNLLSGRDAFEKLAAEIRAPMLQRAQPFWFSTRSFTAYVYGAIVPAVRACLPDATLESSDLIRGVLLHFACREAEAGTYVVRVGALQATDMAFADFEKNSAALVFCAHPPPDRNAANMIPATGNLLCEVTPGDLARLLPRGSISTLFFDLMDNPADHTRVLHDVADILAPDATLIGIGPADRVHGVFTHLTNSGAARMWAQCVVANDATGDDTSFVYFQLLNAHALKLAAARKPATAANVQRIDSPVAADAGPYTYLERDEVHLHADRVIAFAGERRVKFRKPLFVHGPENADAVWMGQFGATAAEWMCPPDIVCPPLQCCVFDHVRLIGTEILVNDQKFLFTASQFIMDEAYVLDWSPICRADLRAAGGFIASDRAASIGQAVHAPSLIMSTSGLPMHYHFLFDALPRLWFLHHADLAGYEIALPDTIAPQQLDILTRYYDIAPERMNIFAADGPCCLFDRACVAPSMVSDWWAMPEAVLAPRTALRHATPPRDPKFSNAKRIYVSRRDTRHSRALVNETELVEALTRLGFIEIFPGNFDYAEEMFLFQNAEIVVGLFGSGMANIMFCSPGARIVILQPDATNWRILSFIMHALDVEYGYVFGESFRRRSRGHNTEWIIDVDMVAGCLVGMV